MPACVRERADACVRVSSACRACHVRLFVLRAIRVLVLPGEALSEFLLPLTAHGCTFSCSNVRGHKRAHVHAYTQPIARPSMHAQRACTHRHA